MIFLKKLLIIGLLIPNIYITIYARPIAYDLVLRNALESVLPQPEAYTFSASMAPFFFYTKDNAHRMSYESCIAGGIGTLRYSLHALWLEATIALAGQSSHSSVSAPITHFSDYLSDVYELNDITGDSTLTLCEQANTFGRSLTNNTSLNTSTADFGFNSGLFSVGYDFIRTPYSFVSLYGLTGLSILPCYTREQLKEINLTEPIKLEHKFHVSLGTGLDTLYTFWVSNVSGENAAVKVNARLIHQFERFSTLKGFQHYLLDKEIGYAIHKLPYNYFNQKNDVGTIVDFLAALAYTKDNHSVELGYNPRLSFNPYFVLVPKKHVDLAKKRLLDSYTRHTLYGQYSFTLKETAYPFSLNVGASYGFVPLRTSNTYTAWLGFSYHF